MAHRLVSRVVHAAALHLAPLLAAEKSRTPFFIAGGLLAAWALIVSLGLGLRRSQFPDNIGGERAVIAISFVLVLGAVSTAVITSSAPAKASAATTAPSAAAAPSAPTAPATPATTATPTPTTSTAPPAAPAAPAAKTSLSLSASPSAIAYDTKTLSAKAGAVTITFTNPSALEHNVTIAQGSSVLGATPTFSNGAKTLTLNLKPGTYSFYCTVPGHRAAGMEGTLTVT